MTLENILVNSKKYPEANLEISFWCIWNIAMTNSSKLKLVTLRKKQGHQNRISPSWSHRCLPEYLRRLQGILEISFLNKTSHLTWVDILCLLQNNSWIKDLCINYLTTYHFLLASPHLFSLHQNLWLLFLYFLKTKRKDGIKAVVRGNEIYRDTGWILTWKITGLHVCRLRWPNTSGFKTSRSTWTC